jgi:hypothetical protein
MNIISFFDQMSVELAFASAVVVALAAYIVHVRAIKSAVRAPSPLQDINYPKNIVSNAVQAAYRGHVRAFESAVRALSIPEDKSHPEIVIRDAVKVVLAAEKQLSLSECSVDQRKRLKRVVLEYFSEVSSDRAVRDASVLNERLYQEYCKFSGLSSSDD